MATTPTSSRPQSGSDIVVPFSEIASLLQSRLSTLELDNLLSQLVGSRTIVIRPGDPITAEWAMDLVNRVAALERGDAGGIGGQRNAKAVNTLFQTFEAYGRLLARSSFLPDGNSAAALAAALGMTTTFQNVIMLATASTGSAATATTDGLVSIFSRLYDAQKTLSILLASSIPGVSNPQPRLLYAQLLSNALDNDVGVTGALSLRSAVSQNQPDAAARAQDRINGISTSEAGDAVVGSIDVLYRPPSTRGETLVLNDPQPFGFVFRVTNRTNRKLDIQLKADFASPRDAWSTFATVAGGAGRILSLRPFDLANPTASGTWQDVQVNVMTPAGTNKGDTGTLRLLAFVPAPVSIGNIGTVPLTVGDAATIPQESNVRFDIGAPVATSGDQGAITTNSPAELRFDATFTTSKAPTSRTFVFRVETPDSAATMQKFFIQFEDADVPINPNRTTGTRIESQPFTLNDGIGRSIFALIGINTAAAGDTLNLAATLAATDDPAVTDTRKFTAIAK